MENGCGILSTAQKVAKNTVFLLSGNLLFRLISLIVTIYLAKYLGVEDFGKYNFVFAYLAFFGILTDLGLGDILVREMSRDSEKMSLIVGNAYIIKLLLSVLAIFLAVLLVSFLGFPADTTTYIYVASTVLLFQSFSDTSKTVFQATLRMKYEIFAKLISKLVFAVMIFYLIAEHGSLLQILYIYILSEFVRTLLNYVLSKKVTRTLYDVDSKLWKFLFKESMPIALSGVFLIIYHRIDVLMLSMMIGGHQGDIAVGLYSAAYKLSEPLGVVSYALIMSLFPVMSKSFKISKNSLIRSYEMGYKFTILLMLPIAVGTTLLSDKIILLVYNESYTGSITALQILVWAIFIGSVNYLMIILLTSMDKQRLNTLNMGFCVVANAVMNYILIPKYSYNGASFATVVTELILFLLTFYFVSKELKYISLFNMLFKAIVCSLLMGIPIYYLSYHTNFNILIICIIGVSIYSVALLRLRLISTEDKVIIRNILKI